MPKVSDPNTSILTLELVPETLHYTLENNLESLEQTQTCLTIGLLL